MFNRVDLPQPGDQSETNSPFYLKVNSFEGDIATTHRLENLINLINGNKTDIIIYLCQLLLANCFFITINH